MKTITTEHKKAWMIFWKYKALQKFREVGFANGPCMHMDYYTDPHLVRALNPLDVDSDETVRITTYKFWFEERRYGNEYWIAVTLDDGSVLVPPLLCPERDPRKIALQPAECNLAWEYNHPL